MEDKIRSFRDLRVWQRGIDLVKEIYKLTRAFPRDEQYGLSVQMRRAAISIPSNIAEGFRRRYHREYKQFLSIALGSCAELETQIVIANELNYINVKNLDYLVSILNHICGMLVNLDKKL